MIRYFNACHVTGLAWGMWFKQLAGNWNVKFPGLNLKFGISAGGAITINGLKFDLMLSDRIQFPSFLGWFRFKVSYTRF